VRRGLLALAVALGVTAAGLTATAWVVGTRLAAPAQRPVGPPPPDLGAAEVRFGEGLVGWHVPGAAGAPCVVLLHGVHADRRAMLGRARFLQAAGYSSLLFDFQAHGESRGDVITFGHLEARDAAAAVRVARETFRCPRVAAIGDSLGGAALLLGDGPAAVDAMVLEAVFTTIEAAVADRLEIRLARAGRVLEPLLTSQLRLRFGIEPSRVRPIDRIATYAGPVMIVGGVDDRHTPIEATRALYAAARGPKVLWEVSGAAHADFHRHASAEYERRVLQFLAQSVGRPR
jgi:fermentation-respiration switch protein FrsA (DUF1100 family)